jgi:DNA repair protein RecO (recombination protein O)
LALVVEVVEEAMPELATEDNVFRLAVACLRGMGDGSSEVRNAGLSAAHREGRDASVEMTHPHREAAAVWVSVTYFCVWMARLMGWWPELSVCAACGVDLRGRDVWWSPVADGVTCAGDHRPQSRKVSAAAVAESYRMAKTSLEQFMAEVQQGRELYEELGVFAVAVLERHMERRIRSAAVLG